MPPNLESSGSVETLVEDAYVEQEIHETREQINKATGDKVRIIDAKYENRLGKLRVAGAHARGFSTLAGGAGREVLSSIKGLFSGFRKSGSSKSETSESSKSLSA